MSEKREPPEPVQSDVFFAPNGLQSVLCSLSDGIFAVDRQWRIRCFNCAAEEITGYSVEEALGQTCHKIFNTSICRDACALRYTLEKRQPIVGLAVTFTNRSGKKIPVTISTALLKDRSGKIIGGVESFRDLRLIEAFRKEVKKRYSFDDIISKNTAMQSLFDSLPVIATGESTVLIEGESGTGKELFARAIHNASQRHQKRFVAINCGAIPEQLLEAELFGFKAGAFTDAKRDKPGRVSLAEGGTLFLDEIGDLPLSLQVKLLRFLQDRSYEPLGSLESRKADVRVISATNQNLGELIERRRFRRDLFYRINVMKIEIPPLRDRLEDVPLLATHFLSHFSILRGKSVTSVSPETMKILMSHQYPGNVRELENIVEHAFVLCPGGTIFPEHLPDWLVNAARAMSNGPETFQEAERAFLLQMLERHNWNRAATAQALGIHKTTFYRKAKRLGIDLQQVANNES